MTSWHRWRPPLRGVRIFFAVWIVLGAIATTGIWVLDTQDRSLGAKLHEHGVVATATVTGLQPSQHNSVEYAFTINGRSFDAGYFGDGPQGEASHLHVGEPIQIVYDAQDPTVSCYCDVRILYKRAQLWRTMIAGLFLASIVSLVATVGILRRRHRGVQTP